MTNEDLRERALAALRADTDLPVDIRFDAVDTIAPIYEAVIAEKEAEIEEWKIKLVLAANVGIDEEAVRATRGASS